MPLYIMASIEDRLGPKWSEKELEVFLEGLAKYGHDWHCISSEFSEQNPLLDSQVNTRTPDMLETLYSINKHYLSSPNCNSQDLSLVMQDFHANINSLKPPGFDEDFCRVWSTPAKSSPQDEDYRKRKMQSPRTPLRRTPKKEGFDLISKPADTSLLYTRRFKDSKQTRTFPSFVYSPHILLNDYAQQVSDIPVSPKVLNWCKCEWFYSYVDRGFFSYNEFQEVMKSLGIEGVEVLSLSDWRALKSSVGKPRRFSPQFLKEEKIKLTKYREAIKELQQGKILPSSYHDMLPYIKMNPGNVSSRLWVGQKVLAIHPHTGDLRSGSILTLDANKYHVQFDKADLGVSSVADTQLVPMYSGEEPREEPARVTFKAGVNIYAMAFLLKLLERKEAMVELLKKYNAEVKNMGPEWKPDMDFQQQYAWICVAIQAFNTALSKVLEIFRLRAAGPEPRTEELKESALALVREYENQLFNLDFSDIEMHRLRQALTNAVLLLASASNLRNDKDSKWFKTLDDTLAALAPACESNRDSYQQVCSAVAQLRQNISKA